MDIYEAAMLTEAPVAIFVFLTSEMNLELYLVHCAVCLTTIDNHGWFDYLQLHEGNFQPSTAILAPVSLRSFNFRHPMLTMKQHLLTLHKIHFSPECRLTSG